MQAATPRGGATPKQIPSPRSESVNLITVPNDTPQNSVEIVQTVEQVSKPTIADAKIVETKTIETVTTTEVSDVGATIQTIETHEIKSEITPEPESVVENTDSNKLSEPENNEMTGKNHVQNQFCEVMMS